MNSFIHQFAETPSQISAKQKFSALLGTRTMTATIEGVDQDKHSTTWGCQEVNTLGTQTLTETIEGSDQDRANSFWDC